MKIDRLIGILSILLQKEKVTAPELAQVFEVSKRTINRDIDDLCRAGIPIVTSQGTGGVNGHYEIALSVDNYAAVDKTYAEVIAAGAESIMEPTTEPWGQRTCYIADPEGNLIEIGSFKEV